MNCLGLLFGLTDQKAYMLLQAELPCVRGKQNFLQDREFWKMSGNFCHLTHVREFCHEIFFILRLHHMVRDLLGCGRMLSNLLALLQNFQLGGHSSNGMWVSIQAGLHVGLQFGRDW